MYKWSEKVLFESNFQNHHLYGWLRKLIKVEVVIFNKWWEMLQNHKSLKGRVQNGLVNHSIPNLNSWIFSRFADMGHCVKRTGNFFKNFFPYKIERSLCNAMAILCLNFNFKLKITHFYVSMQIFRHDRKLFTCYCVH